MIIDPLECKPNCDLTFNNICFQGSYTPAGWSDQKIYFFIVVYKKNYTLFPPGHHNRL